MSGERQHYLPKLLQKGFASRVKSAKKSKKKYYTWYFLAGESPEEKNIDKIGFEKHFYGDKGDDILDQTITDYENRCSILLEIIRNNNYDDKYKRELCEFISHLIIRTKYARFAGEEMVEFVHRVFGNVFNDDNVLGGAINKWRIDNPDQFNKMIVQKIVAGAPANANRSQVRDVINTALTLDYTKAFGLSQYGKSFLDGLLIKQSEIARGGQLKALKNNILAEPRIDYFIAMQWYVQSDNRSKLMLGDVGPIAYIGDNEFRSLYNIDKDEIETIYFPISSYDLVVGVSGNNKITHTFDQINIASAKLSKHSFICAQHTDKEEKYFQVLGQGDPLGVEKLKKMEKELLGRLLGA